MKTVIISDTHNQHQFMDIPEGDLLIHAGDFSGRGTEYEVQDFLSWFSSLPHTHKIFIAGNHDFIAERQKEKFLEMIPSNCIYLNDSGVEIGGINIWGSPVQPEFFDWAFNRKRGADIKQHWDLIPANTDLLITHGPPFGILDQVKNGPHAGCEDLLERVMKIKPRLHVFGHIHEGFGMKETDGIIFINASYLNERYAPVNFAVEIDL